MDMTREWTQFAVDAEVDHCGTGLLCAVHNLQQKRTQRLLELLAKCNVVLVAHGYDENEGIRKEVETELGYT